MLPSQHRVTLLVSQEERGRDTDRLDGLSQPPGHLEREGIVLLFHHFGRYLVSRIEN